VRGICIDIEYFSYSLCIIGMRTSSILLGKLQAGQIPPRTPILKVAGCSMNMAPCLTRHCRLPRLQYIIFVPIAVSEVRCTFPLSVLEVGQGGMCRIRGPRESLLWRDMRFEPCRLCPSLGRSTFRSSSADFFASSTMIMTPPPYPMNPNTQHSTIDVMQRIVRIRKGERISALIADGSFWRDSASIMNHAAPMRPVDAW
jgi:hypothetical protein